MEPTDDEFGDVNVFSEARLQALKDKANEQFTSLCEVILRAEAAIEGFAEWAKTAEKNEKVFHSKSKEYVATLKAIQDEGTKPVF